MRYTLRDPELPHQPERKAIPARVVIPGQVIESSEKVAR